MNKFHFLLQLHLIECFIYSQKSQTLMDLHFIHLKSTWSGAGRLAGPSRFPGEIQLQDRT